MKQKTPDFLEDNALLIALEIGKWSGRKSDTILASKVAMDHKADDGVLSVSKRMLNPEALAPIVSVCQNAKKYFRTHTVAWGDEGKRLLPIAKFDEFRAAMDSFEVQFGDAKARVLQDYEYWRQRAEDELGSLYDLAEYPERSSLEDMMYFRMEAGPVPSSNHLVIRLGKQQIERLKKSLDEANHERIAKGVKSLVDRLREAVEKVQKVLEGPEQRGLRQEVLDGLRDVAQVVGSLNFTEDADLDRICKELESIMSQVTAEELSTGRRSKKKHDPEKRKATEDKLADLREQMDGIL